LQHLPAEPAVLAELAVVAELAEATHTAFVSTSSTTAFRQAQHPHFGEFNEQWHH